MASSQRLFEHRSGCSVGFSTLRGSGCVYIVNLGEHVFHMFSLSLCCLCVCVCMYVFVVCVYVCLWYMCVYVCVRMPGVLCP